MRITVGGILNLMLARYGFGSDSLLGGGLHHYTWSVGWPGVLDFLLTATPAACLIFLLPVFLWGSAVQRLIAIGLSFIPSVLVALLVTDIAVFPR